jgi:phosphoglucosamine mutase
MLFGTDGVRGLSSYFFEKALAYNIGRAVACRGERAKKVVIARDTRLSGEAIEEEIIRGLSEYPTEIVELSVMPTPAVSEILRRTGADYGIMVSASHNPPEYNGIKIFDGTGQKLTAKEEEDIERAVFSFWENGGGAWVDGGADAADGKNIEVIEKGRIIQINGEKTTEKTENAARKDRIIKMDGENADASTENEITEEGFQNIPNGERADKDRYKKARVVCLDDAGGACPKNTLNRADGEKTDAPTESEIAEEGSQNVPNGERKGKASIIHSDDAGEAYQRSVLDRVGALPRGVRLRLDCCHGACSKVAPEIFKKAGAEVFALAADPDGRRINVGTGSTNIDFLRANMSPTDFIGCAFDGDGDRMLAVAPGGFVVDGDYILYVLTLFFRRRGLLRRDTVVGTLMTNYGLEEALKREGIGLVRTDVGDKYVIEKIKEGGYSLGGETSGHIIMNENGDGATGDGILAAGFLVRALYELGIKPDDIASLYAAFPQKTVNIRASAKRGEAALNDGKLNALLGLCRDAVKGAGRILIRRSGTEDKLRITVEARKEKLVDEVLGLLIPAYEEACKEG